MTNGYRPGARLGNRKLEILDRVFVYPPVTSNRRSEYSSGGKMSRVGGEV